MDQQDSKQEREANMSYHVRDENDRLDIYVTFDRNKISGTMPISFCLSLAYYNLKTNILTKDIFLPESRNLTFSAVVYGIYRRLMYQSMVEGLCEYFRMYEEDTAPPEEVSVLEIKSIRRELHAKTDPDLFDVVDDIDPSADGMLSERYVVNAKLKYALMFWNGIFDTEFWCGNKGLLETRLSIDFGKSVVDMEESVFIGALIDHGIMVGKGVRTREYKVKSYKDLLKNLKMGRV